MFGVSTRASFEYLITRAKRYSPLEPVLMLKHRHERRVRKPLTLSRSIATLATLLSVASADLVHANLEREVMMEEWTFDQGKNVACITVRDVIENGKPILYVSHDTDDHSWQFLTGADLSFDDAMVVSMGSMVEIDSTLLDIGHMPPGFHATRSSISDDWKIAKTVL